ncbi:DUF1415 domain-containing protein [Vreelandella malpeensis]|uniref:DUF1415 domain-containing protein n=1 Tax=Vreelandella malpeensis TaxID=1172368 RepID=A0ABS8DNE6_9GAMM|nr:DUF1415 domain-containing protein [Halomonas malpeensis]MCB8887809.1 DUF1415 domain-containing protein [Halomonas malpeensis]
MLACAGCQTNAKQEFAVTDDAVINQTRAWIEDFIVAEDICPFARRELEADRVRIQVVRSKKFDVALEELAAELQWLVDHPETETTLLVLPTLFKHFEHYLDFVELAEQLVEALGFEGVFQLASFHPDYCFDGADPMEASNFTNRSPYAMVHLLREESVEQAIAFFGDTSVIPERNIAHLDALGSEEAQARLERCMKVS